MIFSYTKTSLRINKCSKLFFGFIQIFVQPLVHGYITLSYTLRPQMPSVADWGDDWGDGVSASCIVGPIVR